MRGHLFRSKEVDYSEESKNIKVGKTTRSKEVDYSAVNLVSGEIIKESKVNCRRNKKQFGIIGI